MMFHMLRRMISDKLFSKGLKEFYRENKFKTASFDDIKHSMEKVSGKLLGEFFRQWVKEKGAPHLKLDKVEYKNLEGKHYLQGKVLQIQEGHQFSLELPVAITLS